MRLRAVDLEAFCATTGKKQKCKFPFSFSTISAQETGVFSTLHFSRASQMLFQQSLQEVLLGLPCGGSGAKGLPRQAGGH